MQEPGADLSNSFQVTAYRCRCGHEWVPANFHSTERPRVCPRCKSANWDRPYKFRREGGVRIPIQLDEESLETPAKEGQP